MKILLIGVLIGFHEIHIYNKCKNIVDFSDSPVLVGVIVQKSNMVKIKFRESGAELQS